MKLQSVVQLVVQALQLPRSHLGLDLRQVAGRFDLVLEVCMDRRCWLGKWPVATTTTTMTTRKLADRKGLVPPETLTGTPDMTLKI
jgi:hypothetical protein